MYDTFAYPAVPGIQLQLFADAGTLVNGTGNYVNAYTGATTAFSGTDTMSPGMKTFYDTELLENTRTKLIYAQLGRKQRLPENHGTVVEWRKWNTMPDADKLTEGVIPTGKKFGQTNLTVEIEQYGQYSAVTDRLDMHHVDNVILGLTEELGVASGKTYDKLVRNVLMGGTNVLYADAYNGDTFVSTPASRAALVTAATAVTGSSARDAYSCFLTPDMVAKAKRQLRKSGVPYYSGSDYLAVIDASVSYDLQRHKEWQEVHKYADPEAIMEGEIGKLYGVRFVESELAPVFRTASGAPAIHAVMFFGKDAFGVVDPEGCGMETIIKGKEQVGGPLNQFSTVGNKFEMAAKILYQERMVTVECTTSTSAVDDTNYTIPA